MIGALKTIEELRGAVQGFQVARIIQTAVKLGILDRFTEFTSVDDVTQDGVLSARGIGILCDALVAIGLLEKQTGQYRITPLAMEALLESSPGLLRHSVLHAEGIYRRWADLEHAVIRGEPLPRPQPHLDREKNRVFIMGMHANAAGKADRLVEMLDLTDVQRAVDIAGGPGTYLMALLKRKPDLDVTLIDLPLTLETASEIIRDAGYEDRIRLKAMDVFEGNEAFGEAFDLAILSNILHIEDEARNLSVLRRIHASLRPGGTLVVQDFFTDAEGTTPPSAAIFSVNMLTATARGRSWPRSLVAGWLKSAGFRTIQMTGKGLDSEIWIVRA